MANSYYCFPLHCVEPTHACHICFSSKNSLWTKWPRQRHNTARYPSSANSNVGHSNSSRIVASQTHRRLLPFRGVCFSSKNSLWTKWPRQRHNTARHPPSANSNVRHSNSSRIVASQTHRRLLPFRGGSFSFHELFALFWKDLRRRLDDFAS